MLIDDLIREDYLKTPLIIEAFRKINRADFLPARRLVRQSLGDGGSLGEGGPEDLRDEAELNIPLPIGFGQTISQPLTVAFMLELLRPEPGDKILDIGYGSGWTTALLAYIVSRKTEKLKNQKTLGKNGKVYAIERICELAEFGKKNVGKYNFIEKGIAKMRCSDGAKGWEENAPYDKIQAAASTETLPQAWKDQLKIGGKLVSPVGSSIWLLVKKSEKEFEEYEYPGFVFVPLISNNKDV